ncbi:TetR/AcrR family transcriptional regulator [Kordiimonas aquimaris]|uniref:TetR/AcrR family transcriptional regulator n=1 Tax=Kordiimonas aquimaris TaxID=707591 RepID=UPI0021CEA2A0|nr:TetR/AcrR family transcriptional regulator [Kordiimonas aquimaris]
MTATWLKFGDDEVAIGNVLQEQKPFQASEAKTLPKNSPKRETRAKAKRDEIIKIARQQFLKNGFAGTSVDSIVDVLGGSKSTIYSHFRNKEGLFAAVIRNFGHASNSLDFPVRNGNIRDELSAFALDRQKRVFSDLNISIMRIVIAEAARQPGIAELYFRNAPEPTYAVLHEYLSQATIRGELIIDDIDAATEDFLGGLLQLNLLASLFGMAEKKSDEEMEEKATRLTDTFLARFGASK